MKNVSEKITVQKVIMWPEPFPGGAFNLIGSREQLKSRKSKEQKAIDKELCWKRVG
jgi:hypothetical protein